MTTVRVEFGHPLGVTVPKSVGFQIWDLPHRFLLKAHIILYLKKMESFINSALYLSSFVHRKRLMHYAWTKRRCYALWVKRLVCLKNIIELHHLYSSLCIFVSFGDMSFVLWWCLVLVPVLCSCALFGVLTDLALTAHHYDPCSFASYSLKCVTTMVLCCLEAH